MEPSDEANWENSLEIAPVSRKEGQR